MNGNDIDVLEKEYADIFSTVDDDYPVYDKVVLNNSFQVKLFQKIVSLKPERKFKWVDTDLIDFFKECFESQLYFGIEVGEWYFYDGSRWVRDVKSVYIRQCVKYFHKLTVMYCDYKLFNETDKKNIEMFTKYKAYINKLSLLKARDALIKDVQDEMPISVSQFDRNPYLINCENGTYDLEKCVFREHQASDKLTMITNCYFPLSFQKLDFPRWNQFIDEITCGNQDVAAYLQRALGYSLSGVAKEECMFIAYGKTTRNGKGTLFNTIHKLLGDYASTIPVEFICRTSSKNNDYEKANPMLASLKGVRFVTLSESDDSGRLDENAIKNYTGNDPIRTRNLYERAFTYTPQFKMWLSCNTLPTVTDKSLYTSERLRVLTFDRHFDKDSQDKTLKEQFLEDDVKAYIFKWLVAGYNEYKRIGLAEPKCIQDNNTSYEKENDLVAIFLEEKCTSDENSRTYRLDLYTAYKSWCKTNGLPLISSRKFYQQMEYHYVSIKSNGYYYFKGVTLNNPGGIKIK